MVMNYRERAARSRKDAWLADLFDVLDQLNTKMDLVLEKSGVKLPEVPDPAELEKVARAKQDANKKANAKAAKKAEAKTEE